MAVPSFGQIHEAARTRLGAAALEARLTQPRSAVELKAQTDTRGESSLRGHLKGEGQEETGSQSYIPPDPKNDKALTTALDLVRGIQKNSAYPPNPKTAVPN